MPETVIIYYIYINWMGCHNARKLYHNARKRCHNDQNNGITAENNEITLKNDAIFVETNALALKNGIMLVHKPERHLKTKTCRKRLLYTWNDAITTIVDGKTFGNDVISLNNIIMLEKDAMCLKTILKISKDVLGFRFTFSWKENVRDSFPDIVIIQENLPASFKISEYR